MSRTPALVLSTTLMITPGGWALPADPDSMFANFLMPMCAAWSAIEAQAEQFGPEIDPRTSVLLLQPFQQLLGPDPYGRDLLSLTLSQQQTIAYQMLTARGGQSIPYFLSLAAAVGETATIQEGTWFRFGQKRFGQGRFSAVGNQFNWTVNLAAAVVTPRRFGAAQFPAPFGTFTTSLAQGPIAAAKPAHTVVTFNYSGTETH